MQITNIAIGQGIIFYTVHRKHGVMYDILYIARYHECSNTFEVSRNKGLINEQDGHFNHKEFEYFDPRVDNYE